MGGTPGATGDMVMLRGLFPGRGGGRGRWTHASKVGHSPGRQQASARGSRFCSTSAVRDPPSDFRSQRPTWLPGRACPPWLQGLGRCFHSEKPWPWEAARCRRPPGPCPRGPPVPRLPPPRASGPVRAPAAAPASSASRQGRAAPPTCPWDVALSPASRLSDCLMFHVGDEHGLTERWS